MAEEAAKTVTFIPIGECLLVEPKKRNVEEKTEGGIILAAPAANREPTSGRIAGIGDEIKEGRFEVGEMVQFTEYMGKEVIVNGNRFLRVDLEHIEGVWREVK